MKQLNEIKTMSYLNKMEYWVRERAEIFDDFMNLLNMKYDNAHEAIDLPVNTQLAVIQQKCCEIQDLMNDIKMMLEREE